MTREKELLRRVQSGDIIGSELVIGGPLAETETGKALKERGADVHGGIKAATGATLKNWKRQFSLSVLGELFGRKPRF